MTTKSKPPLHKPFEADARPPTTIESWSRECMTHTLPNGQIICDGEYVRWSKPKDAKGGGGWHYGRLLAIVPIYKWQGRGRKRTRLHLFDEATIHASKTIKLPTTQIERMKKSC